MTGAKAVSFEDEETWPLEVARPPGGQETFRAVAEDRTSLSKYVQEDCNLVIKPYIIIMV